MNVLSLFLLMMPVIASAAADTTAIAPVREPAHSNLAYWERKREGEWSKKCKLFWQRPRDTYECKCINNEREQGHPKELVDLKSKMRTLDFRPMRRGTRVDNAGFCRVARLRIWRECLHCQFHYVLPTSEGMTPVASMEVAIAKRQAAVVKDSYLKNLDELLKSYSKACDKNRREMSYRDMVSAAFKESVKKIIEGDLRLSLSEWDTACSL